LNNVVEARSIISKKNWKEKEMTQKIFKILAVFSIVSLLAAGTALAQNKVVIKGSTTVLPITQAGAEAFMKKNPGVNVSISAGGSGDGIKALIDKTTDIANSSRDLKPEEITLAKSKGVKPVANKVAIDAIVPIVHSSNPISDLSVEQLSLIYQGKIKNWKEVGGENRQIVMISRDTSSGTYETWEQKILHGAKVSPRAQLQASNGAIVQAVSKNKFAIGYIGIGYLNKSVKALKVNGVEAGVQTAKSGVYPVARPLFMFTDGEGKVQVAKFIKFILSPEGQKIVTKAGFVPIK
jgi:phosphate transport system substrate-binding protein